MERRPKPLLAVLVLAAGAAGCEEPPAPNPTLSSATTAAGSSKVASHSSATKPLPPLPAAPPLTPAPKELGELKMPPDNPLTPEKAFLGKQLFFDKRLSKDGSASCETCHVPEKGWGDGRAVSTKVGGGDNTRHSPTLWNVAYNEKWYWDGRADSLEKQVEAAWKSQMGADPAAIAADLAKIGGYLVQFKAAFGAEPSGDTIVKALASFVRTIHAAGTPWDKFEAGDKTAVGEDAKRGWELFRNKAGCAACHAPPLFTDNGFHDTGIGFDKPEPDLGRGKITKDEKENGQFKTPTVRGLLKHPPYFHDGRAETLEAAVDFMLGGGIAEKNPNLDKRLKKVTLNAQEKGDLLAFLKALEPPEQRFERPTLPE